MKRLFNLVRQGMSHMTTELEFNCPIGARGSQMNVPEAGFSGWTTSVCIRLKPSNFLEKAQYLRMVLKLTLAVKKGIAFPDLHEVRS